MRIFKELPIVFPFYESKKDQNRWRENTYGLNQFNLISPKNALLPFQIEMPPDKEAAIKWEICTPDGRVIDVSNNLNLITVYEFADKKQAVYKGDALIFHYESITQPLSLPPGEYYTRFVFADESQYVSEFFHIPENSFEAGEFSSDFVKIDFWNTSDMEPILYRNGFKQVLYLDTFINQFNPEVEEEVDKDGYNNGIPVFQKLMLKYKFVGVVPDFVKIGLVSLQMHDNVYLYISESRKGYINRVLVTATPHDEGGMNDVEVVFEDDIIYKGICVVQKIENNVTTW